jgi:30S ribosomal protein S31
MGKGDQRTKRGKIVRGTFGKTRPQKRKKAVAAAATATEKTPAETPAPAAESQDEG